ncbi:MAG: DUF5989 family protein [Minisyncoccia bacterium]|jgi:hypothetical protein
MFKDFFKSTSTYTRTIANLFRFLWNKRLWFLIPLVIVLVIFGLFIFLGQTTPLGPFIYTIF